MKARSVIDEGLMFRFIKGGVSMSLPYLGVVGIFLFALHYSGLGGMESLVIYLAGLNIIALILYSLGNEWARLVLALGWIAGMIIVALISGWWELDTSRSIILFTSSFAIVRSILFYISSSRIPYQKAIGEMLFIIMQAGWSFAGYSVIKTMVAGGNEVFGQYPWTFYLLVNFLLVFLSSFTLTVLLIWRNASLWELTQKLKTVSSWSLDEKVVEGLISEQRNVNLEPTIRAIVFGDIRGFTRFSEENRVEEVVEVLNYMYHLVDEITLNFGGVKPEFIADEFITYFSNPSDAVDCSIQISASVNEFLVEHGLGLGIGIDYGKILEGIIGSNSSKKYTIIGDRVNSAARLQAEAGTGEIFISESVKKQVEWLKTSRVKGIKLKGVDENFKIYRVRGIKENSNKRQGIFARLDRYKFW